MSHQLRDLTPEEQDLRTRQILMWGHAADCMQSLIDESEKARSESEQTREAMAGVRDSLADVRRTVLLAASLTLLIHTAISFYYSRPANDPMQAKREAVITE